MSGFVNFFDLFPASLELCRQAVAEAVAPEAELT